MTKKTPSLEEVTIEYLSKLDVPNKQLLDATIALEAKYTTAKWETLAVFIPTLINHHGYSLKVSFDGVHKTEVITFSGKIYKSLWIDANKLTLSVRRKDDNTVEVYSIASLDEILLIGTDGVVYDLLDAFNTLLNEHLMPTPKPLVDNIVEIDFKRKRIIDFRQGELDW